jgi:hypothetical protein
MALEQQEARAVLTGDTNTLYKILWAPEFVVNNPANIVVTKNDVIALIRSKKLDYDDFVRIVEKISIVHGTAIAMGREEIKPKGAADQTGKKVTRRYTNIWLKRGDRWQLVARQATITL